MTRNADSGNSGQIEALQLDARFMPESVDQEARTVEVTFATEVPGLRYSWRGAYNETLSFDPTHVRMDRLNAGAPLCDNHQHRYVSTAKSVLGVVEKAWIEGSVGKALVRFSERENADEIFKDVVSGILKNISVGYRVYTYEITEKENGPDEYRAVDWEPFEISIVPVPFDYTAQVRSGDDQPKNTNKVTLISNNQAMSEEQLNVAPETTSETTPQVEETRTATPTTPTPPPTTESTAPATETRSAEEILAEERGRARRIREAVRTAGLSSDVADDLVNRGVSLSDAHDEITRTWAEAQSPTQDGRSPDANVTGNSPRDNRRAAVENAILVRAGVHGVEPQDNARPYMGMRMLEVAREVLRAEGVNVTGMNPATLARTAMNLATRGSAGGYHGTSDFPLILGNTINRTLRAAYDMQPRTFAPFCRRVTASDFKAINRTQLSGIVGNFELVPEAGEYKGGSMTEGNETYKLAKYGKIITYTWEMLVNDDLGAFNRLPTAMAGKAAQLQSDLVYGILTGNPTMSDGEALFSTAHANQADTGGAITVATLSAARAAFRKQKSLEGDFINVEPKFLVVGPDRETEAEQILAGITYAQSTGDVNVFKGSLQLIVEPRLGAAWYLAAAPTMVDTIEYAFLEGEGELYTDMKEDFNVDGMQMKARMVFAAAPIDHRGLYKNAGA